MFVGVARALHGVQVFMVHSIGKHLGWLVDLSGSCSALRAKLRGSVKTRERSLKNNINEAEKYPTECVRLVRALLTENQTTDLLKKMCSKTICDEMV